MEIEWRPLDQIRPYERNARKIPESAIEKVAASLKEYGWQQPIVVDREGVIVAGHTRRLAALKLGWTEAPVHVALHLSPAQIKAYRLMDNRSAMESSFDAKLLGIELGDLKALDFNLDLTGFDPLELKGFFAQASSVGAGGSGDPDAVPQVQGSLVSVAGDLWLLGNHRLLCGDSTLVDNFERLMSSERAGLVFTDPPYNVAYDAEARASYFSPERKANKLGTIQNDQKSPEEFRAFLDLVYSNIDISLAPGRAIYICHADTEGHHFRNAFVAQPWKLQSCLIWKKTVLVFGRADYHWMHEPILYGWKDGASHEYFGDRKQTTIWEFPTDHYNKGEGDTKGKYVHPTQKPVALIEKAIENSSQAGEVVLDPFGGSGSTLIAAEKTARCARLMELEPKYVDVIIRRWQNFTGKAATLEADGRTFQAIAEERRPAAA